MALPSNVDPIRNNPLTTVDAGPNLLPSNFPHLVTGDPFEPSKTATNPTTTPKDAALQSVSPLITETLSDSDIMFAISQDSLKGTYKNVVDGLQPIEDSAAGNGGLITSTLNNVTNSLTGTVNKVSGALTDVLSGKILVDTATDLLTSAEKAAAMIGQAAVQNVMGFLERFRAVGDLVNSAVNMANNIGQNIKNIGNDLGKVLSVDLDKLSWPDVNFDRIKSLVDSETFTKLGQSISDTLGNVKLPIGLSVNQIADLAKNLDLKKELLQKVDDVRNGIEQMGTQALNDLYSKVASVNSLISSLTNFNMSSLTSMVNSFFGKTDPLKERAANKTILDLIKDPAVVAAETMVKGYNDAVTSAASGVTSAVNDIKNSLSGSDQTGNTNETILPKGLPTAQEFQNLGSQDQLEILQGLTPEQKKLFFNTLYPT